MRGILIAFIFVVVSGLGFVTFGQDRVASASIAKNHDVKLPNGGARPVPTLPYSSVGNELRGRRLLLTAEDARRANANGLIPPDTKSLLNIDSPMRHGDYVWSDDGVVGRPVTVWVDLRRQMVSAYRNGHEIGSAVIVYGAPYMESPIGKFRILAKHRDYRSRAYDAPMPYALFITSTGVALHGSPMSSHHATHGCVGLPTAFARLLFESASRRDTVQIVRSTPPPP